MCKKQHQRETLDRAAQKETGSFLDRGHLFPLWLHPSSACRPLTAMGIDGGERSSAWLRAAAELERTENTHTAECFKMSHSRSEGGTESRSVGILSRLFAVIVSWMCRMDVQWSQNGRFGLETEFLKKARARVYFPTSCLPSAQSVFVL